MAKIGTAHIEIKPVLNEEALDALVQRITEAVVRSLNSIAARAERTARCEILAWGGQPVPHGDQARGE